ncbi:MAG TPA: type II secretion system F family protein [Acidimicrobiales bacterium]|nr:type II secretion system F family protein [Acidimicrobiales bacterium]
MTPAALLPGVSNHLRAFFDHIGPLGDAAIVLAVVSLLAYGVLRAASRRSASLSELIEPYHLEQLADGSPAPATAPQRVVTLPGLRRASTSIGEAAGRTRIGDRMAILLRRADVPVTLGELVLVWSIGTVVLVALAYLVAHRLAAGIVLAVVLAGPPVALKIAINRRERKFAEQLPDVLKLTASSLRAGFSFAQSLDGVVRQIKKPAQRELQQVLSEMRLGKVLEDALWDAAMRIQNRDFTEAVMAVRIQQETGGNLASLLDVLANTMTQRVRIRREIRTLTAEGRTSAYVLGLLPVAIGLFIYSANRAYISQLFHTSPGRIALIGGAVLECVGFAWMYRIVKIEV